MTALPQNRILRGLFLAMVIAVVVGYSWLAARMLEPVFELPDTVVQGSAWIGDDAVTSLHDQRSAHWRQLARIANEVSQSSSFLNWLTKSSGSKFEPVDLVIRGDEKLRLVVTGTRIEIGSDILLARGQLLKAFLKAYLLQTASNDIVSSHLRLDVASDLLFAMTQGQMTLGTPGRLGGMRYEEPKPWWSYARSYRGVCDSEWKSLELEAICRARDSGQPTVSPLSFRPLIGSVLWNGYLSQGVAQRLEFTLKWTRYLSRARAAEESDDVKFRVVAEIELLMPAAEFLEVREALRAALAKSRLLDRDPIEADFLLRKKVLDRADVAALTELATRRPRSVVIAMTREGLMSFPGGVLLDPKEFKISKVKHEIIQSCTSPTLGEIAQRQVQSKRMLWIRSCDEKNVVLSYSPLLTIGTEAFARANPGVPFIQLRPEGVHFAIRSGRASATETAHDLLKSESKKPSQWFGLAAATWVDGANAFRVNGAIEAVEWHREAKAQSSTGSVRR